MIVRRLSNEALYLVLACLVLGTLVMAQATLSAFATAGSRPGPSACLQVAACSTARHSAIVAPSPAADVGDTQVGRILTTQPENVVGPQTQV